MRPEFGCGVHDFVFDSIDANTIGQMEDAIRIALERWEPRIEVQTVDLRPLAGRQRPADDRHRLRGSRHQHRAQPRPSVLRHSRLRRWSEAPRDPARRPPLPGSRLRGAHADRARLPRVDRAQRLGPRHHADRAVRVDDGDDDLPAQPRAGQAARGAAGPARHPARRPERRHHEPALQAGRQAGRVDPDRGRQHRGRHAAHRARRVGDLPGRRGLHDPRDGARGLRAAAPRPGQGRRRSPTARPARRAPTSSPSAPRRRSATRSTSASRSRWTG